MRLQIIFNDSESEKILKLMEHAETDNIHKLFMDAIDTMYDVILFEEEQNVSNT